MNETALKERLKLIAKDKGITFNEAWKQLLLERFLARLAKSVHKDKFIFKGGLLLSRYITLGRETTDIDFLMKKIRNEILSLEKACKEITVTEVDDGFLFDLDNIEELSQPHMDYVGWRLHFSAGFGKMRDKIQVDVGVGDPVNPVMSHLETFEYKGRSLFEGSIDVLAYPAESIFSEKLETIISKGGINSRMKDYHDVLLMVREKDLLRPRKLRQAIQETFEARETELKFPIRFSADDLKSLQRLWKNHLSGLGSIAKKLELPNEIENIILEVNNYLSSREIYES